MANVVIGIGDIAASNNSGDQIRTHALGSCVAIIMMDIKTRTVAMAHVALPESSIAPAAAREKPGKFADTAIGALVALMQKVGYEGVGKRLIVKLVGGAQVVDTNGVFNIGKRNILAIKKCLWQRGMGPVAEELGGNISRTVVVDVDKGKVIITSPHMEDREI